MSALIAKMSTIKLVLGLAISSGKYIKMGAKSGSLNEIFEEEVSMEQP